MAEIIYSPILKKELRHGDVWYNLIAGFDSQIIECVLNYKFPILYSPPSNYPDNISDSIKNYYASNNLFNFKYQEDLNEDDYLLSKVFITDSIKLAKNYILFTNKISIVFISYSIKNKIENNNIIIVNSLSNISDFLKGIKNEK